MKILDIRETIICQYRSVTLKLVGDKGKTVVNLSKRKNAEANIVLKACVRATAIYSIKNVSIYMPFGP